MRNLFFILFYCWLSFGCKPVDPKFTIDLSNLPINKTRRLVLERFVYKDAIWSWVKLDSINTSDKLITWPRSYDESFYARLNVLDEFGSSIAHSSSFTYSKAKLNASIPVMELENGKKNNPYALMTIRGGENDLNYKAFLVPHHYKEIELVFRAIKISQNAHFDSPNLEKEVLNYESKVIADVRKYPANYNTLFKLLQVIPLIRIDAAERSFNLLSQVLKDTPEGKSIQNYIKTTRRLFVGQTLPQFTVLDKKGNKIESKNFLKRKFYLLNFWSSSCVPCRKETPEVRQIINEADSSKFEVVYLSINTEPKSWLIASAADNISWMNYIQEHDPGKTLIETYALRYIPQNILINPSNVIIGHNYSIKELQQEIRNQKLLVL